ncbi:unnamed protein product [Blepharisma stoltei]|uniref:Rab-GAP TBC domain-containing protein n=1 Tax=Blepharisma stoltei TaxID=1481888 RepID=A0AAU9J7H5_9CILI|nr:unnamed protein product [Blepharisma stoltei]
MNSSIEHVWGWGHLHGDVIAQIPIRINTSLIPSGIFIEKDHSVMWTSKAVYAWGKPSVDISNQLLLQDEDVQPKQVLIHNKNTVILKSPGGLGVFSHDNEGLKKNFEIVLAHKVRAIDHTRHSLIALDSHGKVYNIAGDLVKQKIRELNNLKEIKQIACGYNHSLALDTYGDVYSWGSASDGRLGNGRSGYCEEPVKIENLSESIVIVACGYLHSVLVSVSGALYTFGFNGYGQLGLGTTSNAVIPTLCLSLSNNAVIKAACGAFHTFVLCDDGMMHCMGLGTRGQLGNGSCVNSLVPEPISLHLIDSFDQANLICGSDSTYIIIRGRYENNSYSFSFISTSESSDRLEGLYLDTETSFRPTNLPPKDPYELALQKKLIAEQARIYLQRVKEKERKNRLKVEQQLRREAKIQKRMRKWENDILPFWDRMRRTSKVEKLCMKGIPPKVRGEVWARLLPNPLGISQSYFKINVDKAIKFQETMREEHEFVGKEKSLMLISLDVTRTFSQLGYFCDGSPLSKELNNLLGAFTLCRPDIGYVQGMSYVAGLLLLNLEVYRAFVVFNSLVASPVLNPFYRLDEPEIQTRVQIFRSIFRHNLAELFDHFESEGVQTYSFIPEWFITIYAKVLNNEIACRIWDWYFYKGTVVLFKTGVAVLKIVSSLLLKEDISGIMEILTNIGQYVNQDDSIIKEIEGIEIVGEIGVELEQLEIENL